MGWFSDDRSPIKRLCHQYEDLVDDIEDTIKDIQNDRDQMAETVNSVHKRYETDLSSTGIMVELYVDKLGISKLKYQAIFDEYAGVILSLTKRKNEAIYNRDELRSWVRKEDADDKEYPISKVSLR